MPRTIWPGGVGLRRPAVQTPGDGTGAESITDTANYRGTSLVGTITPSTASKRVKISVAAGTDGRSDNATSDVMRRYHMAIYRNTTAGEGDAVSDGTLVWGAELGRDLVAASTQLLVTSCNPCPVVVDSPASAGAVTYRMCLKSDRANYSANYFNTDANESAIILEEVD